MNGSLPRPIAAPDTLERSFCLDLLVSLLRVRKMTPLGHGLECRLSCAPLIRTEMLGYHCSVGRVDDSRVENQLQWGDFMPISSGHDE